MGLVDYELIRKHALQEIKSMREEYASDLENFPQEFQKANNSKLFNIKVINLDQFEFVYQSVNDKIFALLERIIFNLFAKKNISVYRGGTINTINGPKQIDLKDFWGMYANRPAFSLIKVENEEPVMYCFWEYGKENIKTLNAVTDKPVINDILYIMGIKKCYDIVLVKEGETSSTFNYRNDWKKVKHSFKWFFEQNFGRQEYLEFEGFEQNLITEVEECLGYSIVKTLTPNALFSFKKNVEEEIKKFPYEDVMVSNKGITEDLLKRLKEQYFTRKYYKAMLRKGDFNIRFSVEGGQFSESFITAEWLYQSLVNAKNIDFTVIAMGYFKAIEELLFVFMAAHSGEKKWIETKDKPKNLEKNASGDRWWMSVVSDRNVKEKKKYIMLERLITFLCDYDDLFEIVEIRDYLVKRLRDAQQLRNGFFHKDNLSDKEVLKMIREDAYVISLLLFGAMNVSEDGKKVLAIPSEDIHFEMLCEHIHYNCNNVYYFGDDELSCGVGQPDLEVEYGDGGETKFSGVHFNRLIGYGKEKTTLTLTEIRSAQKETVSYNALNIPNKIYQGTLIPKSEGVDLGGPKRLIWKDGIYYGDMAGVQNFNMNNARGGLNDI